MLPSDPCPWCRATPAEILEADLEGHTCCLFQQDAEQACDALEASDPPDDEGLLEAALFYWPDLRSDLPLIRQPLSYQPQIVGTEQMNHTTLGARRAA